MQLTTGHRGKNCRYFGVESIYSVETLKGVDIFINRSSYLDSMEVKSVI